MPVRDLLTAGLGGAALGRAQVHGRGPAHAAAHTARHLGPEDLQRIAASGPRLEDLTLEHAERLAGPGQVAGAPDGGALAFRAPCWATYGPKQINQ
ncbi:hypothetical protein CHLRE_12g548901v5 [Chlamydomonas reinhardtii]|uniref:Uncharacterized protein n=1 Tax=Chlamydomonas reinhardtii TaxID=3055 RepID=A0A2K3D6B8_CHLRE|nr:uncharacterized protein CHLRE_12g548901v5 [Chlamydomonas reinhardtii]PNW76072.1 hypothetical protein CHLRE_12g548901v5 [Chlamydomonas reinhardtii]